MTYSLIPNYIVKITTIMSGLLNITALMWVTDSPSVSEIVTLASIASILLTALGTFLTIVNKGQSANLQELRKTIDRLDTEIKTIKKEKEGVLLANEKLNKANTRLSKRITVLEGKLNTLASQKHTIKKKVL